MNSVYVHIRLAIMKVSKHRSKCIKRSAVVAFKCLVENAKIDRAEETSIIDNKVILTTTADDADRAR